MGSGTTQVFWIHGTGSSAELLVLKSLFQTNSSILSDRSDTVSIVSLKSLARRPKPFTLTLMGLSRVLYRNWYWSWEGNGQTRKKGKTAILIMYQNYFAALGI